MINYGRLCLVTMIPLFGRDKKFNEVFYMRIDPKTLYYKYSFNYQLRWLEPRALVHLPSKLKRTRALKIIILKDNSSILLEYNSL